MNNFTKAEDYDKEDMPSLPVLFDGELYGLSRQLLLLVFRDGVQSGSGVRMVHGSGKVRQDKKQKQRQIMRVYISLPMSGNGDEAREKADIIKATLSRAGHVAVNPFDIYVGRDAEYPDRLCAGLRALCDCDAIFLCEGWQFSRGCRIERVLAEEFRKQVMYETRTNAEDNYHFDK